MRKLFLGAAALVALVAPGAASAGTGYVGLDYANTDADSLGSSDAWGADGAVEVTPHVAVDASVFDNDSDTAWSATGHLFSNSDKYLYGAFLGASNADSSTTWDAGLEGQAYAGAWTFAGAISYAENNDADVRASGVNVQARYFIGDNFRVQGNLGRFDVEGSGGDDTALVFGAGGEYQLASTPISLGVGYSRTTFKDADVNLDTWTATVRWNFGGGTLHDRDHSGTALAGLSGAASALGL